MSAKNPMSLETKISAKFLTSEEMTSAQKESLMILNKQAEDVCETLQPIFQNLIIEMLTLKRQTFNQGGQ